MPLFKVTLSDGSTQIMQAHNKTMLREALKGVILTRIDKKRYCKKCRKVAATVQNTLCDPCWQEALVAGREAWKDNPMSEDDLQSLVMSFFVDA